MDFKKFRLNDWLWFKELKEKYGPKACSDYINKVYYILNNLKPGFFYNLESELESGSDLFNVRYADESGKILTEQNVSFCIKICCMWITENQDYIFSDDFKIIKRYA